MSKKALIGGVAVVVAAAAVYYFFFYQQSGAVLGASTQKAIPVTWVVSHYPTDVFKRAADTFASELSKQSNGSMALKVVYPQDLGVTKGDIPHDKVMAMLKDGTANVATDYTVALGTKSPDLWAVNLPFLFSDFSSIGTSLDGAMGTAIMKNLPSTQGVVGLAFTMSGGYRIIASKSFKVTSPADLKGKRIATSGGPVAQETLKALGATPVALDLESGSAKIDPATIDGVETTYSRLGEVIGASDYTKYVSETNHSVFLTALLADQRFYSSLTPAQQTALMNAAKAAAAVERQDSKALADKVKADLMSKGSTVTMLSPEQTAAFAKATKSVYAKFLTTFTADVQAFAGRTQ